MRKSWVANLFTSANIAFGTASIILSLNGDIEAAAFCILAAMVSDALDGRIARALGTAGPLGVELDSLCDCTSFGVAPGILLYASQLHGMGGWGMIPALFLAVCCAFRLARFNIKTSTVHGYFEGLPCPTVGVFAAAYVLSGVQLWNWFVFLCAIGLAFLMVSEIHYPDNKGSSADQLHLPVFLFCLALFLLFTAMQPSVWAAALCAAYILFGMMNTWMNKKKKVRRLRKRYSSGRGDEGSEL